MLKIGITGGIATGKSTVANYIKKKGYPVLDADVISREIVKPDSDILKSLELKFGSQILTGNGVLNRKKLGKIVFNDTEKLMQLNSIMHPKINQELLRQVKVLAEKGQQIIFLEIPLLFETKNAVGVDIILVVTASFEEQIKRLMERNNLTELEAKKRIEAQMPLNQKEYLADYVVENDNINLMYRQVDNIIDRIKNLN